MPYANAADSTPGNDDAEGLVISYQEGTAKVAAIKDDEGNETQAGVAATGGTCRCGCGQDVPAGSLFKPGHDARLKGKLQRALLADVMVTVNGNEMQPQDAATIEGFAPKGTVASLEAAIAKRIKDSQSAEAKQAEKDARKATRDAERAAAKAAKDEAKAKAKAEKDAADEAKAEADASDGDGDEDEAPKRGRRG